MAILFNSKLNTGSLNTFTSNGISSGSPVFVKTEKSLAIELSSGKSVSWTISSSNITNIISFIKGIGTYRVTLNATNIDVSKTTFDYQFQNSSGTYNSITTVTITATSGTIFVNKIVLLNGTDGINKLQAEYYNAQQVARAKRGFIQNKPTDLSSLVRNSLTSLFTDTFSTDTSANYTGGTNIGSVTWNVGEYLTFLASGAAYMTIVRSGVLSTTLPTTVIIRAKSSVLTTTLGLWNGSTYVQSTETLSTEYKNFVFINHVSSTATMTLRPNIILTPGQDLVIDSIQTYTETGLLYAYNMKKNGTTLVDISGNGYNATVSSNIVQTNNGLDTKSAGNNAFITPTSPALSSSWSVSMRIKKAVNTGTYYFGMLYSTGTNVGIIYHSGSGNVCFYNAGYSTFGVDISTTNFDTFTFTSNGTTVSCYKNGVFVTTVTPAGTSFTPNTIGNFAGANFGFTMQDIRVFNRVLSATEIVQYHNSFIQPTLIEDFSDAGADGVTKSEAPTREWERVTGTWKVGEVTTPDAVLPTITKDTKYLENVTAGIITIPSNNAYGSWEFDWYKASTSNSIVTGFISTTRIPTTTGTQGYVTEIGNDEALYLYAFTGSGFTSLMSTAISYIANSTWYRVRITRTTAGVFTVLIKGGAFTPTAGYDGWTLVTVSTGSNPVTNTTYTSSGYFTVDMDAGDRIANIIIKDGIKQ